MASNKENIVIVGGGISGLVAAKTLAEDGFSPLLLEKNKEFGQKACGEMVAEEHYGFSIYDFLDDENIILRKFDQIIFNYWGKEYWLTPENSLFGLRKFPKRLFQINRKAFEKHLAQEAEKAGAEIRMGLSVNKMERKDNSILINSEIKTKLVIGADGFYSRVRKFTGQTIKNYSFAISAEAESEYKYPVLIFNPEIVPAGYAWIFPRERERVISGAVSLKKN